MRLVSEVQQATDRLIAGVKAIPGLDVPGQPAMCLFPIISSQINLFQLCDLMAEKGWSLQAQFGKAGAPSSLHVSVHYGVVRRVDEFLEALRESVAEVRALPPIHTAELQDGLRQMVASNDPDLFGKAMGLAGLSGDSLPRGMAMINTLLEALPGELAEDFLREYFNELYS